MKTDEFDAFFRAKLDELNQVPGVAWNNENAWNKIMSKMGKGFGGLKALKAVVLLISVALMLFVWNHKSTIQPLAAQVDKDGVHAKSLQTPLPNQKDSSGWKSPAIISKLEGPKLKINKRVHSTLTSPLLIKAPVFTTHSRQESLPEEITIDLSHKDVATDSIIRYSKFTEPLKKNKVSIEKEKFVSAKENITATGIHYVAHLTNKFSLVTGFQLARTYNPYFNFEHTYSSLGDYSIQVPLQIRYYLLPRENRLTAFIYSGLSASLPVGGFAQPGSALRIETGGEVRYRIYADKYKNTAYLFIRMPVHNKYILNFNK